MEQALIVDTLRGFDSTGLFCVPKTPDMEDNKGRPAWAKSVVDGPRFVVSEVYKKHINSQKINQYAAVIGHNRAATIGGISVDTAHPFQEGPITLVHNGTLDTTITLEQSQSELKAYNDSHTICHNLAVVDNAQDVLEQLVGAYALIWHDTRDNSINIARNSKRPLHLSRAKWDDTIYIASEGEMLFWLGERLNLKLGDIVEPEPGKWLKFKEGSLKPSVKDFTIKSTFYSSSNSNNYNYNDSNWFNHNSSRSITTKEKSALTGGTTINHGKSNNTKVKVLGHERELPNILQEQLMNFNIEPSDRLEFLPKQGDLCSWKDNLKLKQTYSVYGYLRNRDPLIDGLKTVVHGVPMNLWALGAKRAWTVKALGVYYIDKFEPLIVSRLDTTLTPTGLNKSVAELEKMDKAEREAMRKLEKALKEDDKKVRPIHSNLVLGRHGIWVPAEDWDKQTKGGCVFCECNLYRSDASKIAWVNNGVDPLCPGCASDLSNNCGNV